MYVCMYLCTIVRMYVHTYIRMNGCMHVRMYRGEAIMLVKLTIILSAIPIILPIMLTDFTYCSQNYAWFIVHGITDS